ncbi:MAG: thioredoxin family protein [Flavobacteriia bacterium]|nr:thioredoxin family protein [Flavobacteriia bacterium]OIP47678.1 MAG: thioredoxin family protein [Flavobacteriaceae bacterium CG2_30_31_66]PIV97368.1 MAG: thioredoxin family protein [Flavobacteriaceae bacterium CG17_big_fil_post_rev_8_21_14_2_50_31_13]PIX14235.1 MAG: thioredoxin family protein [Flavobacteriaceae bacterium CG_4_8_14_3_um_filter_31_8]PIY14726.1 MAG: thioredoxin family protein [Flavobacteriaceae bacterium CG_4_10_14_3_um_filter_31_253]PIZ12075.1 MAG: thioredoxin family protein 
MKKIIVKSLENSYSYQDYRLLMQQLLSEGKSTGPIQSEELTNYSLLNETRMKRLDKTIKIADEITGEIQKIEETQTWLVITESWCGDAAQNLPVINKMAELNEKIKLKLVLRDENLELMDLFLTNNSRSIPKLIIFDSELNIINTWGPRPSIATKMAIEYKEKNGSLDADFKQNLQIWYNKNKGENLQNDLIQLLQTAAVN